MMEPAAAGQASPRAFLRIAGASLAQHQVSMAKALGCQRVICIARGASPELIAVQHVAEDAGIQFHLATGVRQLSGLVTAADELFVVADGLFADRDAAARLLEAHQAIVLVQPIEGAQAAGFERIDINRASAGLARLPGKLIERLQELPVDCDVASSLLRIGLQSGAQMVEVPAEVRSPSTWRLLRNEQEALEIEGEWLQQPVVTHRRGVAGAAIGRWASITFGASLLHAGNASNMLSLSIVAICLIAGALGWFGLAWAGFACGAVCAVMVEMHRRLRSAERRATGEKRPAIPRADVLSWLLDIVLVGLALCAIPRLSGETVLAWAFAPAIFFLLLSLLPSHIEARFSGWLADRVVLSLLLALAAIFGQVQALVEVLALVLAGLALFMPGRCRS